MNVRSRIIINDKFYPDSFASHLIILRDSWSRVRLYTFMNSINVIVLYHFRN